MFSVQDSLPARLKEILRSRDASHGNPEAATTGRAWRLLERERSVRRVVPTL